MWGLLESLRIGVVTFFSLKSVEKEPPDMASCRKRGGVGVVCEPGF